MIHVRPLERADLTEAAALFELGFRSGRRKADAAIEGFLERTLFEDPWADTEFPSLIATDDGGRPLGFMAAGVRRFRLGPRPVRVVVTSHLVVDPGAGHPEAGPLLLRRMLDGSQDASVSDTASASVQRMWRRLGGQTLHLQCIDWIRVFRPWSLAARRMAPGSPRPPRRLRRVTAALDVPTVAITGPYLRPPAATGRVAPLTARSLVENLPVMTRGLRLVPDWGEASLEWTFGEIARVHSGGTLVRELVLGDGGRPLGWYVYVLRPDWLSELLQLVATERGIERVLDHLFAHAHAHGSAGLRGRLEPALTESIARRRCLLRHSSRVLIHTRDDEILRAVMLGDALYTRLEGEWFVDALQ